MASDKAGRASQLFVLRENKSEVLRRVANKGFGMAGAGGDLGHG